MATKSPPPTPIRLYQQIEQTAGFYEPAVYDLLTFQNSLQTETDPLGGDFIPLSTVKPRKPSETKIFVIGLIPPSANVTGRLLDRSATVAALQGFAEQADTSGAPPAGIDVSYQAPGDKPKGKNPIVTLPGYQVDAVSTPFSPGASYATAGVSEPDPTVTHLTPNQVYQAIYDAYNRKFGHPPTATECAIYTAQSLRETGGDWPNNNPGYIGNYAGYKAGTFSAATQTGGKDKGYYNSYGSVDAGADAFVGKLTGNPNIVQSAQSGDVLGYMTSLAQTGYYGASIGVYYKSFPDLLTRVTGQLRTAGGPVMNTGGIPKTLPPTCGFSEDIFAYRRRVGLIDDKGKAVNKQGVGIFRAQGNSNYEGCPLLPSGTDGGNGTSPDWQGSGSANANEASRATQAKANRDLNETELGQALQGQQRALVKALQIAIDQMARTPPLRMLVNPTSFKVSEEKITSDGNWGRNGPIVEHWGESQAKISASGKLAGFYAMDASASTLGTPGASPGLTRMARNFSASYQNFLSLYLIYKNNGAIWLEDFADPSHRPPNLSLIGSVYIYYDNTLYVGSFDSLNMSEADDKPFTMDYDFSFTVRATFLLDPVPDPRVNYGDSSVFGRDAGTVPLPTQSPQPVGDPVLTTAQVQAEIARIQGDVDKQAKADALAAKDPLRVYDDLPLSSQELAQRLGLGGAKARPLDPATQRVLLPKKK